jgi:hypothetical protein
MYVETGRYTECRVTYDTADLVNSVPAEDTVVGDGGCTGVDVCTRR